MSKKIRTFKITKLAEVSNEMSIEALEIIRHYFIGCGDGIGMARRAASLQLGINPDVIMEIYKSDLDLMCEVQKRKSGVYRSFVSREAMNSTDLKDAFN